MSEDKESEEDYIKIPKKTKFEKYDIPDCLKVWMSQNDITPEYQKMVDELSSIIDYVCKRLNEGPEVKESTAKRTLTLRVVMRTLLIKTLLNNFARVGLLEQLKFDTLYDQAMKQAYAIMQEQMQEEQKKADKYVG